MQSAFQGRGRSSSDRWANCHRCAPLGTFAYVRIVRGKTLA